LYIADKSIYIYAISKTKLLYHGYYLYCSEQKYFTLHITE
jgi:hypothetical protein